MTRKTRLVDCNPRWGTAYGEALTKYLTFDCPEGHKGCWHTIPFTPTLEGQPGNTTRAGATWQRTGDTFETLTIRPSIRRVPVYASREDAIAQGAMVEHIEDHLLCAMHVNLVNGLFEFAGDSH